MVAKADNPATLATLPLSERAPGKAGAPELVLASERRAVGSRLEFVRRDRCPEQRD